MFVLECTIDIGKYRFSQVHDVEITKSVETIGDTAIIKLPTRFKVRNANGGYIFTEDAIKIGDPVTIGLGYKNVYSGIEFKGYVKKISPKSPTVIECEDAIWLLRRKNITKAFYKTNLKEILNEVVKDTSIDLADEIPEFDIDKWIVKNANGAQVLQSLKDTFMMRAYMNDQNKLNCGLDQFENIGKVVNCDLNYNLVDVNLDFKSREERKVKIVIEYRGNDNKVKSITSGDTDGAEHKIKIHAVSNEVQLKQMAEKELERLKYDGFEGDITTFLVPFSTRGMKAKIIDIDHPNREGSYFIKKVVTSFGTNGARRKIHLGQRL